jgi:hypothetical protein
MKAKGNVDRIVDIFMNATSIECKNLIGIAQSILRSKLKNDPVERKRFSVQTDKASDKSSPRTPKQE